MPKQITIDAYKIYELNGKALIHALHWLDEFPLEYEKEDGTFGYDYYSDIWESDKDYVIEYCVINDYLFDKYGQPIHHLLD